MSTAQHLGSFIYRYNNDTVEYAVRFDTDTALHWECLKGDDKGRSANETATRLIVRPDVHFISWTEADGLVVAQVVDFQHMTVNTVLVIKGERIILTGTVTRVEK